MSLLHALLVIALLARLTLDAANGVTSRFSDLALRLLEEPQAIVRDLSGRPVAVFGVPTAEARHVFLPVSRERAAPPEYVPADLVGTLGRPTRDIIVADFVAMRDAAALDAVELVVVSGYRSPAGQVAAFEAAVWRRLARGATERAEAESEATRVVAPAGHSQHQLGTAVDISSREVGYGLPPHFAETAAGRWVAQNGWAYGFVLPYTFLGESRSGYRFEPWHLRWVGRPLAAVLHADGYDYNPHLVADDYLRAVEELLDAEGIPWGAG
jgi:hypothetical protein